MEKINNIKKIKNHLFAYKDIQWISMFYLFLILMIPTLILLVLDLANMVPLLILTEISAFFLIDQKLPLELLVKLIFLGVILFTFCIFSAAISSFSPVLLLIFILFWFGIYTCSMFFGKLTRTFGLLSIIYFLIAILNLTIINLNTFQIWLISILSTVFIGSIITLINYLKNDSAICTMIGDCFSQNASLGEIFYTEELASEFSNKKLINLIGITKDIKIAKLSIEDIKSNLDLDVLVVFEDILHEVDKLTHIMNHNLSKNNSNFNISLKKFESKLKILNRFKEQDTNITMVLAKSEELFNIFQRASNILNDEFDENYLLPNLTSNIYVLDIIKANLSMDNIYMQKFIRFTLAIMLSTLVLVLTSNYSYYNVLFSIIVIFLLIKPNSQFNTLFYSNMLVVLFAIIIGIGLSLLSATNWFLILIIFLICLPWFKNNILIKNFIFIIILMLIQINSATLTNSLNYLIIWLISSLSSLFMNLIIYPSTSKINLYDSLLFKLKTNFNFVFEVLLSQNLDKYSEYWSKVSNKNNEFECTLNSFTNKYSVDDGLISNYMDVSNCIDALTFKTLAFNTHTNFKKSEHLEISLNLIKNFMDDIIYNLDNASEVTDYHKFVKTYYKINKFMENCDDNDSILVLYYFLWIIYDLYVLSVFLDKLSLTDEFCRDVFIY